MEKMKRNPAYDTRAKKMLEVLPAGVEVVDNSEWLMMMYEADTVLMEGAQGYSLGLNAGFWPYCTSRDCTIDRFMAECAVPAPDKKHVRIGTARTYPIRVGNVDEHSSGGWYPDQREVSWDEIGVEPETTTVTGRERRVATFSMRQIEDAIIANQPDFMFLNFCNYYTGRETELGELVGYINDAMRAYGRPRSKVMWEGWGPNDTDVRESVWGQV